MRSSSSLHHRKPAKEFAHSRGAAPTPCRDRRCERLDPARSPTKLRRLRLEHLLQLLTQLRRVLVAVNRGRVLRRRLEQFALAVGRDRDGALLLARHLPAIDLQSGHACLLWKDPCFLLSRGMQRRRAYHRARFESWVASIAGG